MDKLVLEKKVDSILRTIQRVETHTPATFDIFLKDIDAQDIIVLNLTRIIQSCVDIAMHITANANIETPQTMSESFNALHKLNLIDKPLAEKLIKSVGFRNIAIHTYGELDLNLTFMIAKHHISDFKDFIKQISDLISL